MDIRKKFLKFINKHRLIFSFIFMALALIAIFLPQYILKLPLIIQETSGIELTLYCSQIVSSVFVIAGTIVAVWQYYLSSSKRIREVEFSRVEKAIELSNYYKDNILSRYSFVKRVFEQCGITQMIEPKRKKIELREFDIYELNDIYNKDEIKKFRELPNNEKFVDAIIKLSSSHNIDIKGYKKHIEKNKDSTEPVVKLSVNPQEIINDFFKTYIVQTLNNAEYFAMSFTHNTADESVIYQSIYPTFLEMCFVMYYYIAKDSDPAESKLYTNIAELYCIWRAREQKQHAEYNANRRKGSKKPGTIVECER